MTTTSGFISPYSCSKIWFIVLYEKGLVVGLLILLCNKGYEKAPASPICHSPLEGTGARLQWLKWATPLQAPPKDITSLWLSGQAFLLQCHNPVIFETFGSLLWFKIPDRLLSPGKRWEWRGTGIKDYCSVCFGTISFHPQ